MFKLAFFVCLFVSIGVGASPTKNSQPASRQSKFIYFEVIPNSTKKVLEKF